MNSVLITGGTGLVGSMLSRMLVKKGYKVIILTRDTGNKRREDNISYATWNVNKQEIDLAAIQTADYIIHLAGAGVVDRKWTAGYKKEIVESRTLSSKLIADTIRNHSNKVKAIISSSAIGWYGDDKVPPFPFL